MISLNDTFTFGKYCGQNIIDVMYDDPDYLIWCMDNISTFNLNTEDTDIVMNTYYELSDEVDDYDQSWEYYG